MTIETTQAAAPAAAFLNGASMTATGRAEVARAMAEVLAQVQVAQAVRRDPDKARDAVLDSCRRWRFADKAFYAYPRGKNPHTGKPNIVTGPSVKLARELARAWGNFQYGLVEVDRDEGRGLSVMMAWAWDVETNARNATTFVVPHRRDITRRDGQQDQVDILDLRTIYENNANMGARRVRAMILSMLPAWFLEEAEDECNATIEKGQPGPGGEVRPLQVRLGDAVAGFDTEFGVQVEQLEEFVGKPRADWRARDLTRLGVLFRSLERNELNLHEVFPPPSGVSDEDVAAQAAARPEPPLRYAERPGEDAPISQMTWGAVEMTFAACGWAGDGNLTRRVAVAGVLAGTELESDPVVVDRWEDLTEVQGEAALAALTRIAEDEKGRRDQLGALYLAEQRRRKAAVKAAAKAAAATEQQAAAEQAAAEAGTGDGAEPDAAGPAADQAAAAETGDGEAGQLGETVTEPVGAEHAAADVPAPAGAGEAAGEAAGPDLDAPVTAETRNDLLTRLTSIPGAGLRGTSREPAARRLVIVGVLVHGHWHQLGSVDEITERQARKAIATLEGIERATAERNAQAAEGAQEAMGDVMKRLYRDAVAQRDQVQAAEQQQHGEGDGR